MKHFSPYSPNCIRNFFSQCNANIRKRWGQNFLIDANLSIYIGQTIAKACQEQGKSQINCLLEVGPGFGALTQQLLYSGYRVYAIEIDPVLVKHLHTQSFLIGEEGCLWLQQGDILDLLQGKRKNKWQHFICCPTATKSNSKMQLQNLGQIAVPCLVQDNGIFAGSQEIRFVCGNIPYSITTDFFRCLLGLPKILGGVFLVQSEYAQRILSKDKSHSISVFLGNYGNWKLHRTIPAQVFYPRPKVSSSLIEYQAYSNGTQCQPEILERLLRLSFGSRRQKLLNNWRRHLSTSFPHIHLSELLQWTNIEGIDYTVRAEQLQPEDFYRLCRKIETVVNR